MNDDQDTKPSYLIRFCSWCDSIDLYVKPCADDEMDHSKDSRASAWLPKNTAPALGLALYHAALTGNTDKMLMVTHGMCPPCYDREMYEPLQAKDDGMIREPIHPR